MSALTVAAPEVNEAIAADARDDHSVLVLVKFPIDRIGPLM